MGSLLFKKDKISIPEAHVDKKLFNSVFSMQIFLKPKANQIGLTKLINFK